MHKQTWIFSFHLLLNWIVKKSIKLFKTLISNCLKLSLLIFYLWRKVVCFCFVLFVLVRSTAPGCFRSPSWSLWKALKEEEEEEGCIGLEFPDVWTCDAKVVEHWIISSLKIKLNRSWKFWRNGGNVPLVLLGRSWWAWFNGIYLVRFGFRMWNILYIYILIFWSFLSIPEHEVLKSSS